MAPPSHAITQLPGNQIQAEIVDIDNSTKMLRPVSHHGYGQLRDNKIACWKATVDYPRSLTLIARLICFYFAAIVLIGAAPTAGQQPTTNASIKFEPGVRLRLFRLSAPLNRIRRLAPRQSPNLDRTIDKFELHGDEKFLNGHAAPYIAELTANLETATAGPYRFRVFGGDQTRAVLEVDQKQVVVAGDAVHGVGGGIDLDAGQHSLKILLISNTPSPKLRVEWQVPNHQQIPIPLEVLSTKAYPFRPTNGGTKQLADKNHRPGLRQKVDGVYPSLDIATLHPPELEVPVGGIDTLADGTLVVAFFDAKALAWPRPLPKPNGQLWLFHRPDGDLGKIRRELIADGLFEPCGVCVVDDSIFVSQRDEITRFDRNAEKGNWARTTIASGWKTISFHALSFGLIYEQGKEGHPGYLYMAKGTGLGGKTNPPDHGAVWRVDLSQPNGSNVKAISGGHRTPNGLGWGPGGTLLVTDNQGEYTPANELNVVREGRFYGFYQHVFPGASPSPFQPDRSTVESQKRVTEAAIWLPQDEISNSPTQPLLLPEGWPFSGQLLIGDMRYGGIIRASLERVGETWQGAAYHFSQGFEGGINRLAFGHGGELYAGAIGGPQTPTWAWVNSRGEATYQGLQRLKPNRRVTFDIDRVSITPNGFNVRFTKPINAKWLGHASNYRLQQWTYRATSDYGGPKKQVEQLKVISATPSADRMGATLFVEGLKVDRVVHLIMDPVSADGEAIWSAEAWYTIRCFPTVSKSR